MKPNKNRLLALLAISFGLALVMLFAGAQSVRANNLHLDGTPPPEATPTPEPPEDGDTSGGGGVVGTVSNIFYHLAFPAETIGQALSKVFMDMADDQSHQLVEQYAVWYQAIGEILQAPTAGAYSGVAQSSWPVAAALAPALFILRIALYNWNRLVGGEDSAGRAAGDILTSLVLAVLCGWFLDLVVRLGWWMTGAAMGEAGDLAIDFVRSMSVEGIIQNMSSVGTFSMFWYLMFIAVELGALLAIAGMLMAFAAANAGLLLLAVLGPSIAVASAIPQMQWLRSLWIKAVTVISILPLVAGGIFKSSVYMANMFTPGGILALFIRLMWLWGATGAMLSLAGILGKLTISTTTDAIGQIAKAVTGIVSTAALGATGVGAVGAVGGVAGGAAGLGAAEGAGGLGAAEGAGLAGGAGEALGGGGGMANASAHLNTAQMWSNRGALFDAFGLHRPAQFARALSGSHSLAARREELSSRMDKFGGGGAGEKSFDDVGFTVSSNVRQELLDNYGGGPEAFRSAYASLSPLLEQRGLTQSAFASSAPREAGIMARIYASERDSIDRLADPLSEVVARAGVNKGLLGL